MSSSKKNAQLLLKMKDKSEAVQKFLFAEKKRIAKIEDEITRTTEAIKLEEAQQKRLAERGQGHTTAVREAEMFRLKQLSILETRMARAKQNFSNTEAGNIELRRKIDELRRLILCQKDVYATQEKKLRKYKSSMEEMLYTADNVLYHKEILTKKIEGIDDRNQMEAQDATGLLEELGRYIKQEAKNSKDFYERQMKSAPVFDDSLKDNIMAEIRVKALAYVDEKKTTLEVEDELSRIKDAFARLRDEAIGDQSLEEAIEDFNAVENDCLNIMSHLRAKEMEEEAELQMEAKLLADVAEKEASNAALTRKLTEVEALRQHREGVGEEQDRLRRETAMLKAQTTRWAAALNNVFKAMSVDLETLGITGGRITADHCDLVQLMGVLEAKAERILSSFQKFLAKGGTLRSPNSSMGGSSIASALSPALSRGDDELKRLVSISVESGGDGGGGTLAMLDVPGEDTRGGCARPSKVTSLAQTPSSQGLAVLPGGISPAALSLPRISLLGMGGAAVTTLGSETHGEGSFFDKNHMGRDEEGEDNDDGGGGGLGGDDPNEDLAPMDIADLKRSFMSVSLASLESGY